MLNENRISVTMSRARKLGQRSANPLDLSRLARTIVAKWWIGFTVARGCSHRGIASTGFNAPDNEESGGFMKKLVIMACCADLLKVEMTVPMLIPDRMQSAAPHSTSARPPWMGT